MRQYKLAALPFAPWQDGTGLRHDEFGVQNVQRHEMQVVVELALAGEVAEHVADAVIGIANLEAPVSLEAAAELRIVETALAAEQAEPQSKIARPECGEVLRDHAIEHRRVGRR